MAASDFQSTFDARATESFERAFGISVTVRRGVLTTKSVTSLIERLPRDVDYQEDSFADSFTDYRFQINVDAYQISSVAVEPQQGDRIEFSENGTSVVAVVQKLRGMPAYEYMDGQYRWRLHARRSE